MIYYFLNSNQQNISYIPRAFPSNPNITSSYVEDSINKEELLFSGLFLNQKNQPKIIAGQNQSQHSYNARKGGIHIISNNQTYSSRTISLQKKNEQNKIAQRNAETSCGKENCNTPGKVPGIDQNPWRPPLLAPPITGFPEFRNDTLSCMINALISMINAQLGDISIDIGNMLRCTPNIPPNNWPPGLKEIYQSAAETLNKIGRSKGWSPQEFAEANKKILDTLNLLAHFINNGGPNSSFDIPITCKDSSCIQEIDLSENDCETGCKITVSISINTTPISGDNILDLLCSGKPVPIGVNLGLIEAKFRKFIREGYIHTEPDGSKYPYPIIDGPVLGRDGIYHQVVLVDFVCKDGKIWFKFQDSYTYPNGKIREMVIVVDPKKLADIEKIFKVGIPAGTEKITSVNVFGVPTPEQIETICENCGKPFESCTTPIPTTTISPTTESPTTEQPTTTISPTTGAP